MILHADNFTVYGLNGQDRMLNGVYSQIAGGGTPETRIINDPEGGTSELVLQLSFQSSVRKPLPSTRTAIGKAMRVWFPQLPTFDTDRRCPIMSIFNLSAEYLCSVSVDNTGRLCVWSGASTTGTLLGRTVGPVITANAWWHVEALFLYDAGGDSKIELRVEGQPVLELDSVPFSGANPIASYGLVNLGGAQTTAWYVKDFVVWDTLGTYNNDFLGSVLVHILAPTSDVNTNWAPSVGTARWSILDNIPPVDSQYIYAEDDPLPGAYIATMSDLPLEATSVKAILTNVRASKSDGGDGFLQSGLISSPDDGPATSLGINRPITVAQTYWRDVFEVDPKTGIQWLPRAVNDAQFQINRTA